MTVGELKEMLEGLDDDMEVRLAMQPAWPFEYSISSVEVIDNDPEGSDKEPIEGIVYLVEGDQLGYLPGNVCNQLGWR
jgi:predicted membrane GTPase involved in stress response